jgi:hypothetical protein
MRRMCLVALISALLALPALADDQAKTEKQLNRITAMATDLTGHRVVSITMSDYFQVKRAELVQQRLANNLSYGSLFLARQLMGSGMAPQELSAGLRAGKTIFAIANERHADWKKLFSESKKINGKIDRHLFEHFFDAREDRQRDQDDGYVLLKDSVQADNEVSSDDVLIAADAYTRARDLAMQRPGRRPDESLDAVDALQFRRDHARESAPKASDVGVSAASPH